MFRHFPTATQDATYLEELSLKARFHEYLAMFFFFFKYEPKEPALSPDDLFAFFFTVPNFLVRFVSGYQFFNSIFLHMP
jgi:hypothetical protein